MTFGGDAPAIWQVSAGPSDRSYADRLLDHGVALIGPGDTGPWRSERSDDELGGGFVRRFVTELRTGDVLLLRSGISAVCAVGLVASEYQYLTQFDDVNGWDLQHGRRVRWCPLPELYDFGEPVFGANPPRLSRVQAADIVEYAHRFVRSPPTDWQTRTLAELPVEEPRIEAPPHELREIVAQVQDLLRLYWNAQAFGERPTEGELVAHCVIPLLRALGWPVERIAVEWRSIDVCVFSKLPRVPQHCHFLVEAKRLGAGVEGALGQAIGYASALGPRRSTRCGRNRWHTLSDVRCGQRIRACRVCESRSLEAVVP